MYRYLIWGRAPLFLNEKSPLPPVTHVLHAPTRFSCFFSEFMVLFIFNGGVLYSRPVGKTIMYGLNPR